MICFLFLNLKGQSLTDIVPDYETYKVGLHLSPNGYGPTFRYTHPWRRDLSYMFDFSMTSVKNVKEKLIINQRMINTTSYIYGKVNRLYAIRPMIGVHKVLADKINKNNIGINGFIGLGPTIGLLKPNYVDVEMVDPNLPNSYISVAVRYNPYTIPSDRISGYSSFTKGMNETKMLAGFSMKAGADFNWGYYSAGYKSLEMGVMLDCFPSRPELMYGIKNKLFYSSFYISFAIGESY